MASWRGRYQASPHSDNKNTPPRGNCTTLGPEEPTATEGARGEHQNNTRTEESGRAPEWPS